MKRIDRFAEVLFRHSGENVVLAAGAKVVMHVGGQQKNVTSASLGAKLLADYLREMAPDSLVEELEQDGEHVFRYASPHGDLSVRVRRLGDSLHIELSPCSEAPPAPESAQEPEPAPSPRTAPAPDRATEDRAPESGVTAGVGGSAKASGIDALFREMVEHGCSDLHLSSGNAPLYRKDGGLTTLSITESFSPERVAELLFSITPDERRAEFETCGDADFAYEIPGVARFRCNLFRDRKGMGGVFRTIPTKILTAEDLGLSSHILKLCHLTKGLVVVTGPTGSGKSTTLAAMVDYINGTRTDHILTIEDPIEFVHENKQCLVNQREIGGHTEGFKSALRAALREDPDIVLVGEMRDLETVAIAIETAETGHLVFGTLHTNTAPSTIDRIVDQFPTNQQSQIRAMLSESLKGVIAQTLCKKKGGGRVAALEVLIANHAISNLIREGKTFQIPSMLQMGKKQGMVTMNDALIDLVERDLVEPEEAWRQSVARSEFAALLTSKGYELPASHEEED